MIETSDFKLNMFLGFRRVAFHRWNTVIRRANTGVMLSWVVLCVLSVIFCTWASLYRRTIIREGSGAMTSPLPDWVYNGPREPPPDISGSNVYFWINEKLKGVDNFCSDFDNYSTATMEYDEDIMPIYYPGDVKPLKSRFAKLERMMNFTCVKEAISTLNSDPDIGVIDVSYQSSLFALYAAMKGHHVMVINPILENILGVWKTLNMNKRTERSTIFYTSPTEDRALLPLPRQGLCKVFPLDTYINKANSQELMLPGILLDDVMPFVNFEDVLLVMDRHGNYNEILNNGIELFHGANVYGVLMETLGDAEDEEDLENVVEFMNRWGLKPNVDSQESASHNYVYFNF